MTYNQIIAELQRLLESHAMIKTAKNVSPKEWLNRDEVPEFPVACYSISNGTFKKGRVQVYNVQLFFLDKSGADNEFEQDVISDQVSIAYDIISLMRASTDYSIDDDIPFNTLSDKYEDYLAGVEVTFNITTQSAFDGCDAPIV